MTKSDWRIVAAFVLGAAVYTIVSFFVQKSLKQKFGDD